ncbi:ion channel [Chitinophagaceae bacterium 26-R-25]|nr:ion channel [Chitinophagaceae bacterium 26-R-25]
MNAVGKKIQSLWAQEASLTVLLCILFIHIFIVIPFGQGTTFGRLVFFAFYICLLVTGILIFFENFILKLIVSILVVLIILGAVFRSPSLDVINNVLTVLYCMLLSWVVLLRTFHDGPVTVHRVLGAVVVYLLISFIFALLYQTIYLIEGSVAFKGLASSDRKEFMYFSLTTLTTAGYGDINPSLPFSRSLANMEALIGQLYPAVLIARLVSMEFESSKERKQK